MTIRELLECADYNLQNNGVMGYTIGKAQLHDAVKQLNNGKDLDDEYEGE